MTDWNAFTLVTGAAAGALVGLLFVAVTLRIDTIAAAVDLRSRAAQTLTLFMTALVVSIVLSIPEQYEWILGLELTLTAILGAGTLLTLNHRAQKTAKTQPVARLLDRVSPNGVTMLFIAAAGLLVFFGIGWGLYLLVPAVVTALVGGVIGAWLFLVQVPKPDR